MPGSRQFALTTVFVGVIALLHATFTWPTRATIAFFVGGALIAFVAEALVIGIGWLEHHVGPKVAGVPLYVLFGWTGVIYVALRLAFFTVDGWSAVVLAAALATGYDLLVDHQGVEEGYWTYTDNLPGPRRRGVPWWNFLGWFVISGLTAAIAVSLL
ncbi:carotenoid biosynthesis protein [Natronosalvus caseinilyticus]|uniref:carotenoid biosynthesis protein n=1 Tax=Natronosalvus caseinilyticus TaxID=2953747 RepID=UPI0028AFD9FC|nr:carotenoid biosynthesis protein [Natronosalvus caseinilyticus]